MYRLLTQEWNEVRFRVTVRWPALDGMDRATWLLAVAGLLGVFVGWG